MKASQLTATKLRIVLSISLFLIVAVAITIFYFANSKLKEVATTVSHTIADSTASQSNLQILQQLEKRLAEEKETVERVNGIVADSQSYQYQNQILHDLNTYASQAGITISNLDFSAGNTASTPSTAAPAAPAAGAPAAPIAPTPSGVKSTTVSVTLVNPIEYTALLRFIKSIEQNLTKMQISKISLSKGTEPNQVTSDSLTIEVYIR